jgi:hypothetical protein
MQVKKLASEIMNMKLQGDMMINGKVSKKTKEEIKKLFEDTTKALSKYENTPEASKGIENDEESVAPGQKKNANPNPNSNPSTPNTLRDSLIFIDELASTEERESLLDGVGLSQTKLSPLRKLPSIFKNIDMIGESLIQFQLLKNFCWNNYYNMEALWVFR